MALENVGFFVDHPEAMNELSEEQVMALSRGESVEYGETKAVEAPAAENLEAPAQVAAAEVKASDAIAEIPPVEEPVLLAKDGKHVIPYSRLTEATEKAAQLEAALLEKDALIASLQAAKIEDEKTGGTAAQEAVMADYAGEFPEVANDLKPFIQAMIDAGVKAKTSELKAELDTALAPMKKAAVDKTVDAHFATVKDAHADFDQLVESNAVADWIKTQPKFMQDSMQKVYDKGTAAEVVELFSLYKEKTQPAPAATSKTAPTAAELKKQADAVIAAAKGKTPSSLTDLPSGSIAVVDEVERMNKASASQLLSLFEGKSPDFILKQMARQV